MPRRTVHRTDGSATVRVNRQIDGGRWYYLGTFRMASGVGHRIVPSDDAESGYAYNYFRNYDPSLVRYLQVDSVGLAGR